MPLVGHFQGLTLMCSACELECESDRAALWACFKNVKRIHAAFRCLGWALLVQLHNRSMHVRNRYNRGMGSVVQRKVIHPVQLRFEHDSCRKSGPYNLLQIKDGGHNIVASARYITSLAGPNQDEVSS